MQRSSFAARAQFAPNSRALRASREAACGELAKHLHANEKVCDERRVVHKEQGFMMRENPRLLLPGAGGPRLAMLLVRT